MLTLSSPAFSALPGVGTISLRSCSRAFPKAFSLSISLILLVLRMYMVVGLRRILFVNGHWPGVGIIHSQTGGAHVTARLVVHSTSVFVAIQPGVSCMGYGI